jgi:hypothetical protein
MCGYANESSNFEHPKTAFLHFQTSAHLHICISAHLKNFNLLKGLKTVFLQT